VILSVILCHSKIWIQKSVLNRRKARKRNLSDYWIRKLLIKKEFNLFMIISRNKTLSCQKPNGFKFFMKWKYFQVKPRLELKLTWICINLISFLIMVLTIYQYISHSIAKINSFTKICWRVEIHIDRTHLWTNSCVFFAWSCCKMVVCLCCNAHHRYRQVILELLLYPLLIDSWILSFVQEPY